MWVIIRRLTQQFVPACSILSVSIVNMYYIVSRAKLYICKDDIYKVIYTTWQYIKLYAQNMAYIKLHTHNMVKFNWPVTSQNIHHVVLIGPT